MPAPRPNSAPRRNHSPATVGELLALQIAMCIALLWVCLPLRESHPFLPGVLIGLYVCASFPVLRGIYRSPSSEPERRFGD